MTHECEDVDDSWAPTLGERLDDLGWFIDKMRERMQALRHGNQMTRRASVTVVPPKLLKAKRRVIAEPGDG